MNDLELLKRRAGILKEFGSNTSMLSSGFWNGNLTPPGQEDLEALKNRARSILKQAGIDPAVLENPSYKAP